MFGSQYNTPASFIASIVLNTPVFTPLLRMYKDAFMHRMKPYGLRIDDKNIHTPTFFRAINKFDSKTQQQYLRRANRAFDCITKKEKVPQNVWGACSRCALRAAYHCIPLRLSYPVILSLPRTSLTCSLSLDCALGCLTFFLVAEEELPHHRWMAKAVEESAYELQEIEEYEELAHQDMKAHKL